MFSMAVLGLYVPKPTKYFFPCVLQILKTCLQNYDVQQCTWSTKKWFHSEGTIFIVNSRFIRQVVNQKYAGPVTWNFSTSHFEFSSLWSQDELYSFKSHYLSKTCFEWAEHMRNVAGTDFHCLIWPIYPYWLYWILKASKFCGICGRVLIYARHILYMYTTFYWWHIWKHCVLKKKPQHCLCAISKRQNIISPPHFISPKVIVIISWTCGTNLFLVLPLYIGTWRTYKTTILYKNLFILTILLWMKKLFDWIRVEWSIFFSFPRSEILYNFLYSLVHGHFYLL